MIELINAHFRFPVNKMSSIFSSRVGGEFVLDDGGKNFIHALKDLSIKIENGERIGIIGKNGAGKTTLLRLLAGIYHPVKGTVKVNGSIRSILSLGSGMIGQSSGYENIKLRCSLYGISNVDEVMEDVAEFSGLGSYLSLPVVAMSAGMKMRLAFALATAGTADVLILDEWIQAGDAEFRAKSIERMQKFVSSVGTIILASHNRSLIKKVCGRILQLDRGCLKKDGPIEEFPYFAD